MGSPLDEVGRNADETPHEVALTKPFYMGITEVTNGQVRAWNPGHVSPDTEGVPGNDGDQPATTIRCADAGTFAVWLGAREGRAFRLPTEAEWEFAARAGSPGRWFWGEDAEATPSFGNVADRSLMVATPKWNVSPWDDGFAGKSPVGSFLPNQWGLFDVLGNVAEWVEDGQIGRAHV